MLNTVLQLCFSRQLRGDFGPFRFETLGGIGDGQCVPFADVARSLALTNGWKLGPPKPSLEPLRFAGLVLLGASFETGFD
ncbi:hypothetical protein [Methylorubrum extorquens]|uniref:hypothetical protein n=1 Tax=Methylorubrum extorquens TaxID=408 RepID=UPI00209F19B5|nr:hypothetical protein [Methylorubrum extorquens]MCP1538247.1 hypothetical protein [Methylorubrum extorquens]